MKKTAFVIPWYGDKIPGGAESACRSAAKHLQKASYDIEIITTCIKEFKDDWNINFYEPGLTKEGGISVRRFLVCPTDKTDFARINQRFMADTYVSEKDQKIFFSTMISSPDLLKYLKEHKKEYHCFVFLPYMFQTSIEGVEVVGNRAILMPCLHDEGYAHTKVVEKMMASVRGLIYLSKPEYELAKTLYAFRDDAKHIVLGAFLSEPNVKENFNMDIDRFRQKNRIKVPYILYAGRKDHGKNADLLERYFIYYKEKNPHVNLNLVFIGDRTPNKYKHKDIIDLGFVSLEEKYSAMAGALFLCQPSVMESFSIVIMESWLEGRPVVVNSKCAVTKNFAEESNGGLWFENYNTFAEITSYFLKNEKEGSIMAQQGKKYVENTLSANIMIEKLINFLLEAVYE